MWVATTKTSTVQRLEQQRTRRWWEDGVEKGFAISGRNSLISAAKVNGEELLDLAWQASKSLGIVRNDAGAILSVNNISMEDS